MAVINLSYFSCVKLRQLSFDFDTDTGNITNGQAGTTLKFSDPACNDDGDLLYEDSNWQVYARVAYPYAYVKSKEATCDVAITSVTYTLSGDFATITINATGTAPLEYTLLRRGFTYSWQDSNQFIVPAGGTYGVVVRRKEQIQCQVQSSVDTQQNLLISASKTNETTAAANDGKISVTILTGSGSYRVDWLWDATFTNVTGNLQTTQRLNLPAGTYNGKVTDLVTGLEKTFTLTITEPAVELPGSNHFKVPRVQSFTFVEEQVVADNVNTFKNTDNTLYRKQDNRYFTRPCYQQKYIQADIVPVQFQSNFEDGELSLWDYKTDEFVASFQVDEVVQNTAKEQLFPVTLRDHGNNQTRVYFNTGAIPIPVVVGESMAIANNLDGFNGSYTILEVNDDATLNAQYLVINKTFGLTLPTSGTGVFFTNFIDWNVWEGFVDFRTIPEGEYYVKIRAFTGTTERVAVSEPINLKASHPDTNRIGFRNLNNVFDMNWQTGAMHFVRVESRLFAPKPGGDRTLLRMTNGKLRKLAGQPRDRFLFELFQLTVYLHRKLAVVFEHDYVEINGVEIQTEEGYGEPQYITRYTLMNASVIVEVVNAFENATNTTGLSVDAETGFLKISESGVMKI